MHSDSSSTKSVDTQGNGNDVKQFDPQSIADNGVLEKNQDTPESIGNTGDELSRYESNVTASRTLSRKITGADELYEKANNTDAPLPKMGGDRPYPPPLPDRESYMVSYDGPDDPDNPHNWSLGQKILISFTVGLSALSISTGSAMFASGSLEIEAQYHVGPTVATLGTSLFVFGFASGPVIWGPLSELFGRRMVMICSSLGYVCFCFATATSKDIQAIMICRFFSGFVGAAPLVVAPAAMADLFGVRIRGMALSIFAMVLFGGPMLAPIIGAFTVKNDDLGWRWTQYISGIIGSLALVLSTFFLRESHHPLILVRKAEILRRRTGNWGIQAPHEEVNLNFQEIVQKNITRPIIMLFTEPILFLITLYNAFIYGLLYLFLTAVPLIFQTKYHFEPGIAELPYLSMFIGIIIGGLITVYFEGKFNDYMTKNGGKPCPELRLPAMMVGSFFYAAGLFWLTWAGAYAQNVHWIVPTIGAASIGIGLITIFLPCINYIIDCYLFFAASALAGNTFLRSAFGAAFPLFARQMFVNMGIEWAGTLLGCLAVALIPVPFLFYKYGEKLRAKSKYAVVL